MKKYLHTKINKLQTYSSVDKLYDSIKQSEYVSFDIFDTLVKRDVPKPIDIFSLMEYQAGISDFRAKRVAAEATARRNTSSGEVSLKDIYEYMPDISESVEDLEKHIEMNTVVANQELIHFFDYCKHNKKVILISDMYLDRATIVGILEKCGITGYHKLYISNELGKSKSNGSLFQYVLEDLQITPRDLLHIGNAFKADYLMPKIKGIPSIKVATYKNRTIMKSKNVLCSNSVQKLFLNYFINNHTYCNSIEKDRYMAFGYEVFGPLIYGFICWLFQEMQTKEIEQVFFFARDGYILQNGYRVMGLDKKIKDYYFEASRRSLRVPTYSEDMSYEEFIREMTVPNKTTLVQIFDSLGLEINDYLDVVKKYGLDPEGHLKRDELCKNQSFKRLFGEIRGDILCNAQCERTELLAYLKQFDFSRKTAVVDIGWGGSMQMYLCKTLSELGIEFDIHGYYVGLTEKSKENIGGNHLNALGYVFDRLNNNFDRDLERPFVGLFETLFLEQNGSVKKYVTLEDGRTIAQRYPYEYLVDGEFSQEAISVRKLQDGAMRFIEDFGGTVVADYVGFDSNIMFSNLYQFGIRPTLKEVKLFGDFVFFNNASKISLAKPKAWAHYLGKPKELIRDLYDSQWKIGFLKRLIKLPLPYLWIFDRLRRAGN